MNLTTNDWVGLAGVTMLLVAFFLNLWGKISKDGLTYILMNMIGAGIACLASWLINYIPFVILEGTWALISLAGLIRYLKRR
jgi:hypothetical protein